MLELRSLSAAHRFQPAFRKNGELFDVETSAAIVFTVRNGRAVSFDMVGVNDRPWAKAVREE